MTRPGPRYALWEPSDPQEAARERQAAIRRRKEALRRTELIAGREYIVDLLPGAPCAEDFPLSRKRATAWLGISNSQMLGILRGRSKELTEAGCYLGNWEGRGATFSRLGLLHLALILDPERNSRAAMVQAALAGTEVELVSRQTAAQKATHTKACSRQLERAHALAVAVRELDPREAWAELDSLDRWQLQAVVIALAAMVPPELPGTGWLATIGRSIGIGGTGAAPGRGLAALIPRRDTGTWDLLEGTPTK